LLLPSYLVPAAELLLGNLLQVLQPSCFHLTKSHAAELFLANLLQVLQLTYNRCYSRTASTVLKAMQASCFSLTYHKYYSTATSTLLKAMQPSWLVLLPKVLPPCGLQYTYCRAIQLRFRLICRMCHKLLLLHC
jgi:hypothetical protein